MVLEQLEHGLLGAIPTWLWYAPGVECNDQVAVKPQFVLLDVLWVQRHDDGVRQQGLEAYCKARHAGSSVATQVMAAGVVASLVGSSANGGGVAMWLAARRLLIDVPALHSHGWWPPWSSTV
jgi:hypothetical protein